MSEGGQTLIQGVLWVGKGDGRGGEFSGVRVRFALPVVNESSDKIDREIRSIEFLMVARRKQKWGIRPR